MRGSALIVAGSVCALAVATGSTAQAHLRTVGGSLLDLLARGDGVVVARVIEATQDAPESHTRMRRLESLGGEAPRGEFLLGNASSPLRYAKDQRAIVVLKRSRDRWIAAQVAGEGLVLADEKRDRATAAYVASLWKAVQALEPPPDMAERLRPGLELPHQKIRLLSAFDIAELAHHPPGLTPATRRALYEDLEDPNFDPAARVVLSGALGALP